MLPEEEVVVFAWCGSELTGLARRSIGPASLSKKCCVCGGITLEDALAPWEELEFAKEKLIPMSGVGTGQWSEVENPSPKFWKAFYVGKPNVKAFHMGVLVEPEDVNWAECPHLNEELADGDAPKRF
jgi:hypothetical protein